MLLLCQQSNNSGAIAKINLKKCVCSVDLCDSNKSGYLNSLR
jgi:hypothetical protein